MQVGCLLIEATQSGVIGCYRNGSNQEPTGHFYKMREVGIYNPLT